MRKRGASPEAEEPKPGKRKTVMRRDGGMSADFDGEDRRRAREARFTQYNAMVQAREARPNFRVTKLAYTPASVDIDLALIPACEGTCQALEKDYLRLTTAPDPATIRPEPVLKKALAHVLGRHEQGCSRTADNHRRRAGSDVLRMLPKRLEAVTVGYKGH